MGLSASDLAGCRSAISAMLPDTITLYGSDAATLLWQGPGRVDNDRSLTSMRNASDFVALVVPYQTPVAPGQVVQHTQGLSALWYLVAKVSVDTAYTLEEQAMLLALPSSLTVTRPSTTQTTGARSAWGSPAGSTATSAAVSGTATTFTIHAGLSNAFDPVDEGPEGPLPRTGTWTLYTPLGAGVQRGDQITLPDGRPARVDKANVLDANGVSYALQAIVTLSAGSGLS